MKASDDPASCSGNSTIIALRVTAEQKSRLIEQAELAGLTMSSYIRQRVFGGRPIVASVDTRMIGELRRLGGMLKFQCQLLREQGLSLQVIQELNACIIHLGRLISRIGAAYDRQKN